MSMHLSVQLVWKGNGMIKALVENSFSFFKNLLQSQKIPVAVQSQAGCVD